MFVVYLFFFTTFIVLKRINYIIMNTNITHLTSKIGLTFCLFLLSACLAFSQCDQPKGWWPTGLASADHTSGFSTGTSAFTNINYVCPSDYDYMTTTDSGYVDLTSSHIISKNAGSSFNFVHNYSFSSSKLRIWVDWNGDGNFSSTEIAFSGTTVPEQNPVQPITGTISIPANTQPGDYVMRIRSTSYYWGDYPSPCGDLMENGEYVWYGSAIDFTIRVTAPTACVSVANLTDLSHTTNSISLNWTAVSTASSYTVKWGLPGFDPTGPGLGSNSTASNFYTITGLSPHTLYDVYVQTVCSSGSSVWSTPVQVNTGYCIPRATNVGVGRLVGFKTENAINNINFLNPSPTTYLDQTTSILTTYVGNSINCTFSASSSSLYFAFVDWNNDLDFDDVGEAIISTPISSMGSVYSTPFSIPNTATPGFYRMRITNAFGSDLSGQNCNMQALNYQNWIDFILEVVPAPSCKPISSLSITNPTHTTLDVSWTATSSETSWNIEWGPTGFTLGSGLSTTVNGTPSYTITGLNEYTLYDVYVQASCGGSTSAWSSPATEYTGHCHPNPTQTASYYIKTFKTFNALDNVNYQATSSVIWSDNPSMVVKTYEGNTIAYEILQNMNQAGYKIWVDWNNDLDFTDIGEDLLTISSPAYLPAPALYSGSFTVPTGTAVGSYKMRVGSYQSSPIANPCIAPTNGNYVDFILQVESNSPPSCLPVESITGTATSSTSIDLSWVAQNGETSWIIEYGPSGFTPGSGTTLTVNSTSYTLTNLISNTTYDIYIQADCGASNTSVWSNFISVYIGYCIPEGHTLNTSHYIQSFTTSNALQDISYTATSNPGGYVDLTAMVLLGYPNNEIDFAFHANTSFRTNDVWIDWTRDFDFDDPGEHIYTVHSGYHNYTNSGSFIVPAGIPLGDYRVRIQVDQGLGANNHIPACGPVKAGNTVDFTLRIVAAPTCPSVVSLTSVASGNSSYTVNWISGGTESSVKIEWGTSGFSPGTNSYIGSTTTSGNSYTISNLIQGNTYEVYVQADCGGTSTWTGPHTITFAPCVVWSGSITNYTSSFSTTGGTSNITYSATQNAYHGYGDFYGSQMVSKDAGLSFNFNLKYVGGQSVVRIWVDWNNDNIFDDNEEVYNQMPIWTNGPPPEHNGLITIPANQPAGIYRMRVRSRLTNSFVTISACDDESWSTTLDFALQVTGTTACPPVLPSSLQMSSASFSSASITWTAQGSESMWSIKWGLPGFDPSGAGLGSGTSSTNSYTINGLSANTSYDIYVQANCGGNQSIWTGPVTVLTGYCTPSSTYSDSYYISQYSTSSALTNVNYTASSGVPYVDATSNMIIQSYPGNVVSYTITASSYIGYYFIWVDWNNDLDFDDPGELVYALPSLDNGNSSHSHSFTVPSGTPLGSYRMRIAHSAGGNMILPCGNVAFGNMVDMMINVNTPPSCMPVDQLTLLAATSTSANISWTSQGSETSWNVEYGPQGFSTGSGTSITVNNTPSTTITSLTQGTNYDIYVQANCGSGNLSIWNGPLQVSTNTCIPSGFQLSNSYYVGSFSTSDAIQDISYTATSNPGGYIDLTSLEISVQENGTFNYTIAQNTGIGRYFIWVDWNNDLDFDDVGESILSTTTYTEDVSNTMTIPSGVGLGTYRMRIANSYVNTVGPCGPSDYGNYVDMSIKVISCAGSIPDAGTLTGANILCINSSATLTASVAGGTWQSNNPSVLAVINGQVIAGQTSGTAMITYTVKASNGCAAHVDKVINVVEPNIIHITGTDTLFIGDTLTFSANIINGTWASSDTSVATIDPTSGLTTGQNTGTTQIIYTVNSACQEVGQKELVVIKKDDSTGGNGGEITGIAESESIGELNLFPNPTINELTIEFTLLKHSQVTIQLIDLQGKIIHNEVIDQALSGKNSISLDLSNLARSVYSVFIQTDTDVVIKKIIKQ